MPEWIGTTNADFAEYALDLRQALNACNADKSAIARSAHAPDLQ